MIKKLKINQGIKKEKYCPTVFYLLIGMVEFNKYTPNSVFRHL